MLMTVVPPSPNASTDPPHPQFTPELSLRSTGGVLLSRRRRVSSSFSSISSCGCAAAAAAADAKQCLGVLLPGVRAWRLGGVVLPAGVVGAALRAWLAAEARLLPDGELQGRAGCAAPKSWSLLAAGLRAPAGLCVPSAPERPLSTSSPAALLLNCRLLSPYCAVAVLQLLSPGLSVLGLLAPPCAHMRRGSARSGWR